MVYSSEYKNAISVCYNQCNSPAVHIDNFPCALQNSTEVEFCETDIFLNKSLKIKNKRLLMFGGNTTLTCLNSGGFIFENVNNLTIHGITLINCGVTYHGRHIELEQASIFLLNCANVSVFNFNAINSTDIDLFMFNTEAVHIVESRFAKHNTNDTMFPKSRVYAIYEMTDYSEAFQQSVTFVNCTFGYEDLTATSKKKCTITRVRKTDVGSGLKIILGPSVRNVTATILNCTFQNLYTSFEGGVYILLAKDAQDNTISIKHTNFVNNTCFKCGGGGLRVDFMHTWNNGTLSGNVVSISMSNFTGNCAKYGGGMFVNTTKSVNPQIGNNNISLHECYWTKNTARFGSAVDAIEGSGDAFARESLLLESCMFANNRIESVKSSSNITVFGQGTISSIHFHLNFEGHTLFTENIGSPLYLSSSYADFSANSHTIFEKNQGLYGGAIALFNAAAIRARSGSKFEFTENRSYFKGGAIYYKSINGHDYLTSRRCFVQYVKDEQNPPQSKPRYIFTNNNAGIAFNKNDSLGKSIYATTLHPCSKYCDNHGRPYKADNNTLECAGNFEYNNTIRRYEIATSEWNITVTLSGNSLLSIIPGKEIALPVVTTDELKQELDAVYKVTLWHNNTTNTEPWILPAYRYIHNKKIALKGQPSSDILKLSLTTVHSREIMLTINVQIVPCPPGYILDEKSLICRCSGDLDIKYNYQGIIGCDATAFRAKLQSGYWLGYNSDSLIGSICPRGFCFIFSNSSRVEKNIALPESFNITALDRLLCNSRTGKLCARCRENRSVYYNSNSYRCKKNRLCKIGLLFYGISELVPVTFIFLTVTILDVQLTSGATFGLILYYQLIDTMLINANNIITFSNLTYEFYKYHRLFSQMFNLNFFVHEVLSFCLWEGATTLDIIAFKYVTIAYALLMVFLTILVMTTCNHTHFCTRLRRVAKRKTQVSNSVIHGLSGFFILCYSECVRVSLLLLKPIIYEDPYGTLNNTKYVLYNGEMKYLVGTHLKYAVPAFFFLIIIVSVPPILLIAYPLCYRVLALFRLQESKCSRLLCMLIPLEKLKPFFDSFQGSFKDKHRYTSGLYFIYRLVAVCLAVFTNNFTLFYTLLELLFLVMIFILAYCQPHKKSKHNKQDLFVFVTLATVNILTFYNFTQSVDKDQQSTVNIATSLQTVFLYIPTVYIAIKVLLFIIHVAKRCCIKKSPEVDDNGLFERDLSEECETNIVELHHYKRVFGTRVTS